MIWLWLFLLTNPQGTVGQRVQQPHFFIEQIVLEKSGRVSREIVLAQGRLEEGQSYTEPELGEAVRRLRQLSFIIDARFSLRRGSVRGRYQLVIDIEEARPFFFDIGTSYARGPHGSDETRDDQLLLGYRAFLGRNWLLYFSSRPSWTWLQKVPFQRPSYQLGVSRFNLFGKGAFFDIHGGLTEAITRPFGPLRTETDPLLSLDTSFGYPLGRAQWVKVNFLTSSEKNTTFLPFFNPIVGEEIELAIELENRNSSGSIFWEWNTLDDSFLPTSGSSLRLGYGQGTFKNWLRTEAFEEESEDRRETREVFLEYERHAPLFLNHSWRSGIDLAFADKEDSNDGIVLTDFRERRLKLSLGYLWSPDFTPRGWGDFFAGLDVGFHYTDLDIRDRGIAAIQSFSYYRTYQAEAFIAHRGKWGLARFSYRYTRTNNDTTSIFPGARP